MTSSRSSFAACLGNPIGDRLATQLPERFIAVSEGGIPSEERQFTGAGLRSHRINSSSHSAVLRDNLAGDPRRLLPARDLTLDQAILR